MSEKLSKDVSLDALLRPKTWEEYIGQEDIKKNLRILIDAAKSRNHSPEHILLYGPAGLGKTTLSHIIGNELNKNPMISSGSALQKAGDVASILTGLKNGDVLFIDEIHRLPKVVEEVLYTAMEDGVIDIMLGKGASAKVVRIEIEPITIIGATTKFANISSPLRSRFSGGVFRLKPYTEEEIKRIITLSAKRLNVDITEEATNSLSKRSRSTPRTANYLLKRSRDVAQINNKNIDDSVVEEITSLLKIDEYGLTDFDYEILNALKDTNEKHPVGLKTISNRLSEEENTIEEIHEPFLLQDGLIEKTPRGRVITKKGLNRLEKTENI